MNPATLRDRVMPILLGGTRRQPLPDLALSPAEEPARALHVLSLVGQALRFERPPAPAQFTVEHWPRDERRLLPPNLRGKLVDLLYSRKCADASERILAWTFARTRLRPHPFDFPSIREFVRKYAQHLGVAAQHWAQRDTPAERRNEYFDAEEISAKNWTEAPRASRLRFLEEMRQHDPAAARELLASSWGREEPETRLRLLAALQTGLTEADREFLKTLDKDRAPRVRMLAQRLLAKLPGASGENPALRSCLSRIQKLQKGKLRRSVALKLELPANVKEQAASRWIQEQFEGVCLEELANALEISADDMPSAAKEDPNLLFALALMASREKHFALLESITHLLPDAWGRMSAVDDEEPSFSDAAERQEWARALVHPAQWNPEVPYPAWDWLLRRLEGPLPQPVMDELLRSKWWSEQAASDPPPRPEVIQVICALCPPQPRGQLRGQVEALAPESNLEGLLLLDILERLESFA